MFLVVCVNDGLKGGEVCVGDYLSAVTNSYFSSDKTLGKT